MKENKRTNANAGFSLVELIIVIAIMAVLTGIVAVCYLKYTEKAKETKALTNAKAIYDAAQVAIIDASAFGDGSFKYALKFEETIDGEVVRLGRFSNQSLYKYLQERNGAPSMSSARSKKTDYHIAEMLVSGIPGADSEFSSDALRNQSPIGDSNSTKYIADHPEIYGEVVFAMAYNQYGDIVYFQCVYDDYFITSGDGGLTVEEVSDSTRFNNWPRTRAAEASDW